MKILQISDIHLNRNSKRKMSIFQTKKHLSLAEERVNRVFYIINKTIEKHGKPNCVIFSGDIFDKRYPTGQDYHDIFNIIDYLDNKLNINYCFMSGNHDDQTVLRKSPLIALSHLFTAYDDGKDNRVRLAITDPQIYQVTEQGYIIIAPWGTSISSIQQLKQSYKNKKIIVYMHCGVFDGKSHWVENDLELGNIPLTDIQSLNCPVGIGHFHGQMEIAPNIWYCGSLECFTFGEQNQNKGALLWDYSQDELKIYSISAPYCKYKTYGKNFLNIENEEDKNYYIRIKDQVTLQEYKDLVKKAKKYTSLGVLFNLTFVKPEKVMDMNFSKKINSQDILFSLLEKEGSLSDNMKKNILEKHEIIEQKLLEI